jgi:protoporphyrinogen oxidase
VSATSFTEWIGMERVEHLIVGAGVSGLAFANFVDGDDYLIVEADTEIGGYCKTVKRDGFVWDYSGHFFHFKRPEMERYLLDRMPDDEVKVVVKQSDIVFKGKRVDFPFQKNIHQLPQEDFIECLYDLFFKEEQYGTDPPENFEQMLYQKFGRGIAERFLIPYNEKLYACPMSSLDADAMGRFFPYADVEDIVRNMKSSDNASYNATFTYPRGGAIRYVQALKHDVPDEKIAFSERLESIDLKAKVARTNKREIAFEYLISSAPFDQLMRMTTLPHEPAALSYNKVLVFNLGFDGKSWDDVHWVYFPERDTSFYRIGFYDNIFDTDRMSLYVELGYAADAEVNVEEAKARVLADLERHGIIDGHKLVASHHVVLDPAYVHINSAGQEQVDSGMAALHARGVYSIGRYGGWTYCSIEDNMVEARDLARTLNRAAGVV